MKKIRLLSLLLAAAMFSGCGPSDQDILKKYETYSPVEPAANKAGICLELTDSVGKVTFHISYSDSVLRSNEENVNLLSERLFMVNAENPSELLDVKPVTSKPEEAGNDSTGYFSTIALTKETAVKYALVCFKGIDKSEFERVETPPCFFIVSLDREKPHVLTGTPLSAGELVAADYPKGEFIRFNEPQVYSGVIPFENSKNVALKLTLSADATQVTELELTAEELYLYPKNYTVSKNDKTKIEFRYIGQLFTSLKGSGIEYEAIKNGRITTATPLETLDDKIVLNDVITCELSVMDACIYGTVKVSIDGCATKPIYAVFRNITTPQEVPENISEPVEK
ncbi:MAG: hypothetical protein LBF89_11370 [Bacteroidales bacterium]|jgi:hypothetical protein|nr:hypothetical protein [Bacteroidales bacterium]